MRSLIKFLSIISAFLCTIIFILIYVGDMLIPDSIMTVEDKGYIAPEFLGLNIYNSRLYQETGAITGNSRTTKNNSEIKLLNIIPVKKTKITNTKRQYVVIGGDVFGIKLYTDGVIVVGTDTIETDVGDICPAEKAGLKIGDVILFFNDIKIESTKQLTTLLQENKGNNAKLTIKRDGKNIDLNFATVKEKDTRKYKAGLWVRDSTAGIGTVTFYNTSNNSFGGLGHAICDVDTGETMPMRKGEMAEAYVNGLYKSQNGCVGELCGVLTGKTLGTLCINDETGIYGYTYYGAQGEQLPVAVKQEVKEGNAKIYCTVDKNPPQYYDVKIVKVYSNSSSVNKDLVIEVTDKDLISKTGGILQGMSGTPIIQNGMLVGAITHVFVNNPKQGYGIFAERMLETSVSREMQKNEQLKNAS